MTLLVIFQLLLALAVILVFLTGVFTAFFTNVVAGIVVLMFPPLGTIQGLCWFAHYNLAQHIITALGM